MVTPIQTKFICYIINQNIRAASDIKIGEKKALKILPFPIQTFFKGFTTQ